MKIMGAARSDMTFSISLLKIDGIVHVTLTTLTIKQLSLIVANVVMSCELIRQFVRAYSKSYNNPIIFFY
jgi:hypothetical protein